MMSEYQRRYFDWLLRCMGEDVAFNLKERNHRFCEEALELLQACGYSKDQVLSMVDEVYSRMPSQYVNFEIGDVQGTLSALASARGISLYDVSEYILNRNMAHTEEIQMKHSLKKNREK